MHNMSKLARGNPPAIKHRRLVLIALILLVLVWNAWDIGRFVFDLELLGDAAKATPSKFCCDYPLEQTVLPTSALTHLPSRKDAFIDNIVVGVVTSGFRQRETVPAIRSTWGAAFSKLDYYSSVPAEGIVTKVVPTNSKYARAAMEEMHTYRLMYERDPNAEWYMKTDDDAFVNTKVLLRELKRFPSDQDWFLGLPLNYTHKRDGHVVYYCAGGAGNLVSNSLMRKMQPYLQNPVLDYCCSDVQLGKIMLQIYGENRQFCTPLSPYVLGDAFYRYLDMDQMKLRGYYFDEEKKRLPYRYEPMETAMANIVSMHYVQAPMQQVYLAFFNEMDRCLLGARDVEPFPITIPSFGRWETRPCAPNIKLQFQCQEGQLKFEKM